MLCALMALNGLAPTPGNTARYVLVPDLAKHAGTTLARAASLFDAVSRGARMVGAALAGLLIALTGAETVLLLDAATFALSAPLVAAGVRGVRAAEPRKAAAPVPLRTYRAELGEGYRYLLGDRMLLAWGDSLWSRCKTSTEFSGRAVGDEAENPTARAVGIPLLQEGGMARTSP